MPRLLGVLAILGPLFVGSTIGVSAQGVPFVPPRDAPEVLGRLQRLGLPIGASVTYTAETDPNNLLGRPNGYESKVNFLDTRLAARRPERFDSDDGGSVEMFSSTEGAEARERYIQALGRGAPVFVEYDFVEGRVLLRLSNKLTPNQAREYEAALIAAVNAPYCRGGRAPEFILGFAALKAQIGAVMGDPVECEHANPENGDAIQSTTTGLSFFRKSTNTATFTNGSEHWGLTPSGLVFWTGDSIDPPPGATSPRP